MIYTLIYEGGPEDGTEALSPRPYEATWTESNGAYYKADAEGDECLEWAGDDERVIRLKYQGTHATSPLAKT